MLAWGTEKVMFVERTLGCVCSLKLRGTSAHVLDFWNQGAHK